ncbi:MAG: DNA polymerase IV [Desulfobulbaceae bacterium]|jgi:DNA polymerase-4|nr:DNA polymerase IV [Desulfobulbaceae bacterium]MDY0351012.1 DNA polymerase IV [Desulfobulbaceae bacterium]
MNRNSGPRARVIIHVDMDAFYASVEILDNPGLRGRPVVVGGTSDRSVVSAASYEARKYGIHSAMATVKARRLCPRAVFLPVRMDRYREVSDRIMAIFHRFTPLVEPISLDEAFLDVTGSNALFGDGPGIAAEIRKLIREETGLTASAGVATSKLVAKIASDLQKPDGLTVVEAGREREFLAGLPIGKLWGAGRKTMEALALLSVETIGDLAALDPDILSARFGLHGSHLHLAANGIDNRPVVPLREVKSIGHEETFSEDLIDLTVIRRELLALAARVGERLRRHGLQGQTITVKIKYHDFSSSTRSLTLAEPTSDTGEIFQRALELLGKTEAGRKPLRLAGISVSNLTSSNSCRQQDLFGKTRMREKTRSLYEAVDQINKKFGRGTVNPATLKK